MSSPHKSPSGSNNGAIPSSQKKPSLPVRFIKWTMFQIVSFILTVLILGIGYAAVTWTNIPSGSGAAGQPVTQTLIQGIINNMNYLSGITSTLNTTITAVNTQLDTVNPSGTTLSGSSLCLDGVCKGSWGAISPGIIASYAASKAGTYSCNISNAYANKPIFYAVVTGTSLRAYIKTHSSSGPIVCDSGVDTMNNYTTSTSCSFSVVDVMAGGYKYYATISCGEGWNGMGCILKGHVDWVAGESITVGTSGDCTVQI